MKIARKIKASFFNSLTAFFTSQLRSTFRRKFLSYLLTHKFALGNFYRRKICLLIFQHIIFPQGYKCIIKMCKRLLISTCFDIFIIKVPGGRANCKMKHEKQVEEADSHSPSLKIFLRCELFANISR